MSAEERFKTSVLIAADHARREGFDQTYLALLDVLRAAIYSDEKIIGSPIASMPTVACGRK
ncbi:MAG: hypothetical protein ABJF86_11845 [Tateyamaria sp.]|uniref:hypothetical protein n=1 Tax=Roseobacteraceae TaxID=2854170 RepID=UPI00328CACDB